MKTHSRKQGLMSTLAAVALLAATHAALAVERWQTLPHTPTPPHYDRSSRIELRGIRLYNAEVGHGRPVILLHGGLANSDWWALQVKALRVNHRVIVVDSRGHGRSTRDTTPYSYDLMADDVIALMDKLRIRQADIVGWSDGAIQALDMAMRHPDRVGKIVAFGANTNTDGTRPDADKNPTFAAFIDRTGKEYAKLSPTPNQYQDFLAQIGNMWAAQPNWTDDQLRSIRSEVLVMDGDHDEAIKRSHTEYMARTIPHARLTILPDASHFAFIQAPEAFNEAILNFLDDDKQ
ncbi:alpha/beta hydrolase [Paraburkholderia sp. Cy-641]|uniref:alpha/beta fold hydrolase n=1 Tax=Paraburkholderia sp. Cy-641 TaxID=2608337 RepID=UPI001964D7BD|nr:alpha/beta hydrolase [Paraburkholderia sp. Cy-641]